MKSQVYLRFSEPQPILLVENKKNNYFYTIMELKACCKINLGLRVVRRRDDGFHDIETVMVPVRGLYDELVVKPLDFLPTTPPPYPAPAFPSSLNSVLEVTGAELDCPPEQNICMRALRLVQKETGIGEALIRLHKIIPSGAGLGGGSADAAAVLLALNQEFVLELSDSELERLAAQLGCDVPFFIRALAGSGLVGTQLCTGRGEILTPMEIDLSSLWLVIAKPQVSVSTAEAYAGVIPQKNILPLPEILRQPVSEWRELLVNDFELSILERYPQIAALKNLLYDEGAIYASMSGSGSAVFGLFAHRPTLDTQLDIAAELGPVFVHIEKIT